VLVVLKMAFLHTFNAFSEVFLPVVDRGEDADGRQFHRPFVGMGGLLQMWE